MGNFSILATVPHIPCLIGWFVPLTCVDYEQGNVLYENEGLP